MADRFFAIASGLLLAHLQTQNALVKGENMDKQKQLNVRLPADLHKQAKSIAAATGESLQAVTERLLREWTEQQERQQQNKRVGV